MARDWETRSGSGLSRQARRKSSASENAIRGIRNAVNGSAALRQRGIKVFTQGSYRNRVNTRQDSDVDVGVMLYDYFLSQYPEGKPRPISAT